MLAQHFHYSSAWRQEFIIRSHRRVPLAVGRFKYGFQAIR